MQRPLTSLVTVAVTCVTLACSRDAPVSPAADSPLVDVPRPPPSVDSTITQRYLDLFAEAIPHPSYFRCGTEKITTTAYLQLPGEGVRLLTIYTSIDGRIVNRSFSGAVIKPAGAFRALVAIVRYPETFSAEALPLWEAAQQAISNDYASFTTSAGRGPIVTFEHTNVMLDAAQVANPRSRADVKAALELQGWNVAEYDFLISLNLRPDLSEGGFAVTGSFDPAFIYIGNFGSFRSPLTTANMTLIAGATYYHEVSHHWGWPGTHDWRTGSCPPASGGYAGGLAAWLPAILFGWTDVDGDGVPEILDATPYGRSQ